MYLIKTPTSDLFHENPLSQTAAAGPLSTMSLLRHPWNMEDEPSHIPHRSFVH
jgi:hypothetical protein